MTIEPASNNTTTNIPENGDFDKIQNAIKEGMTSLNASFDAKISTSNLEANKKLEEASKKLEEVVILSKSQQSEIAKLSLTLSAGQNELKGYDDNSPTVSYKSLSGLIVNHKKGNKGDAGIYDELGRYKSPIVIQKSISSSNNALGGNFLKDNTITEYTDINALTTNGLSNLVRRVSVNNAQEGNPYRIVQYSNPLNQMTTTFEGEEIQFVNTAVSKIKKIAMNAVSAYIPVSRATWVNRQFGNFEIDPIELDIRNLEASFDKSLEQAILQGIAIQGTEGFRIEGIIPESKKPGSLINTVNTKTAGVVVWDDIYAMISRIKSFYTDKQNMTLIVDKSLWFDLWAQSYLPNQFHFRTTDTSRNGAVGFSSPLGLINVIPTEPGNGLDTYVAGGSNTNKKCAILADFEQGYVLPISSKSLSGFNDDTTAFLKDQMGLYKYTFVSGAVNIEECISVLNIL